jgi:hypothetical protein
MASPLRRFGATGALTLVVVPLALLAAGCGGSSSATPPATTTTAAASGPAAGGARGAAFTAFTSCLKAHGIASTGFGGFGRRPGGASGPLGASGARPRFNGSGPSGGSGARGGFGRNLTAAQQKAFTTCRSKLPAGTGRFGPGGGGAGGGGGTGTTRNPAFAKYTQCLAKHGVKLGSSSSPSVFTKASAACAKLRPVVGGAPTSTNSTTG